MGHSSALGRTTPRSGITGRLDYSLTNTSFSWCVKDTFLNFPSIKFFEILQKLGSDEEIASDTFLTMSRTACHAGSPADLAIRRSVRAI